jgi:poly(3-hydroxybutyrate) depolymerase
MRVALNPLLIGLGLAVAACGSSVRFEDAGDAGPINAGDGGDAGDDGGVDAGEDAGPPNPNGTGCSSDQDKTGLVLRSGKYGTDGLAHDYYSYVPASYSPSTAIALIISLHGAGDTAKNFVNLWETDADSSGFMVLVPEASATDGPGYTWDTTDTDLIIGATDDIQRCYHTDMHRHILHGFSAGGLLAYILGLSQADLFSGLAIASSDLGTAEYYWGELHGKKAELSLLPSAWLIPVSMFHGSQDPNFPIAETGEPSRDALLDAGHTVYWHEFNGGHTTNTADALQMWEDLKGWTSP